jgi:hypothetical protein
LRVPFNFQWNLAKLFSPEKALTVSDRHIPVVMVRNVRARRYVLRLRPDGSARVTIPRGGTVAEAQRFAERNQEWLARQLQRQAARPTISHEWRPGTEIFFRGELVKIEVVTTVAARLIRFGSETIKATHAETDLRPAIERHLRQLAAAELPVKTLEYAARHQLFVRRVTVRNQKSRWGSCSRRGTISLNWRLIQTPDFVRDYIVLHELMHLRQMNHSARFWHEVEQACPDYPTAERWLKQHAALLR